MNSKVYFTSKDEAIISQILVETEALAIRLNDEDRVHFTTDHHKIPHVLWPSLLAATEHGVATAAHVYITGCIAAEGPKILQLRQLDAEAMENMELDITLGEYDQPFNTLLVSLPDDYCQSRTVVCPQASQPPSAYYGKQPDKHHPVGVALHHKRDLGVLLILVYFSSGQVMSRIIQPIDHPDMYLEEILHRLRGEEFRFADSLTIDPEEERVTDLVCHIAMNAAMVLSEGPKRVGPPNKKHHERLQKYWEKAKKKNDPAREANAKFDYQSVPIYYTFDQHVKVYDTARESQPTGGEGSHTPKKPHWRKGYRRRQNYGPGNTLVKKVRIPAVFVNAHLYKGRMVDAQTTYHMK